MTSAMTKPVTPARSVRAEWVKFYTLKSHWTTLAVSLALILGLAFIQLAVQAAEADGQIAISDLLAGVSWAQFTLTLLAAVVGCTEWSSDTSKVSFLAVPARWPVLLGKVVILSTATFLVGSLGSVAALAIGAGAGVEIEADPAFTVRFVVGTGLYLATLAALALGIGTIVRNLAATILIVIVFFWVAPFLAGLIPMPEIQGLALYLPVTAGGLVLAFESPVAQLTPWGGYAVLLIWTVLTLVAAASSLLTRDV